MNGIKAEHHYTSYHAVTTLCDWKVGQEMHVGEVVMQRIKDCIDLRRNICEKSET